jgi:hypothetical protein
MSCLPTIKPQTNLNLVNYLTISKQCANFTCYPTGPVTSDIYDRPFYKFWDRFLPEQRLKRK